MSLFRRLRSLFVLLPIVSVPSFMMSQQKTTAMPLPSAGHPVQLDDSWKIPDFSGIELVITGKQPLPRKIFRSGTSLRVETTPTLANLYVPSNDQVYRLTRFPDKTLGCIVMSGAQAKGLLPVPLELLTGTKVKRTPAGEETVKDHPCKIEDFEVTREDGKIIKSKVWEAEDLQGIPVKIESETEHGKFAALYGDIELGTPDKALFTPPEKCTPHEKMFQVAEQSK